MSSADMMIEDKTYEIFESEYDKYLINTFAEAVSSGLAAHKNALNTELNDAWERSTKIKYLVSEALTIFLYNNFDLKSLQPYKESKEKLLTLLPNPWKFSDFSCTFLDVAKCICHNETPIDVIFKIKDLLTDRHGSGMVIQLSDFTDEMRADPIKFTKKELWFILYLFAADEPNSKIALNLIKSA